MPPELSMQLREEAGETPAERDSMIVSSGSKIEQRIVEWLCQPVLGHIPRSVHPNTISLVNRLSADEMLRQSFVNEAVKISGEPRTDTELLQQYRSSLSEFGIIKLPSADPGGWWESLKSANYFGLLITALLLSLVLVPPAAVPGITFARFRVSTGGCLQPFGPAPDGEVEDYPLEITTAPA